MTVNNHTIPSWQKVVVFSSRNQNDSLLFHGIFILKNARHTKKNTSAKQLNYFLLFWTFSIYLLNLQQIFTFKMSWNYCG